MFCNVCKKNQATVHLTEIINDQVKELHVCEECARKKGIEMEKHFGLSDLLAGLADFEETITKTGEIKKIKCPSCGMTYDDFKKIGQLGCADCYCAFRTSLEPLLKKIHGSTKHLGKATEANAKMAVTPAHSKAGKATNISNPQVSKKELLKAQLKKAIEMEEFEQAAKIRDKMKAMEKK